MFELLRERIAELTRPYKAQRMERYVRTICVPLSRSLESVMQDYQLTYPLADEELAPLLVTAKVASDAEEYVTEIESLLSDAFAADLLPRLADKGFAVLNTINLIIVLADLQEEGTLAILPDVIKAIARICEERQTSGTTFYLVGGFIVRRGRSKEPGSPAQQLPKDWKTQLESVQQIFSRMYLLDMRDSPGREIEFMDQRGLLQNLIHMLTGSQAGCATEQEFAEWLSRGYASDGEVDFLGGASVTFPMDQMVQLAAVIRGSEAIKHALLSSPVQPRWEAWGNTFRQEQSLVSLDDARIWLKRSSAIALDPIADLDPGGDPRIYMEQTERLDAALPQILANNVKRLTACSEDRVRECEQVLSAFLDSMISTEEGGLVIAKQFLELVQQKIREICPANVVQAEYSDSIGERKKLQTLLDEAPADLSLGARVGFGTFVASVGVAAWPMSQWVYVLAPVAGLAAFSGFALTLRHMSKEQIQNRVVKIDNLLREKWQAISEAAETRVLKEMFESLQCMITSLQEGLNQAIERVTWLVDDFAKRYQPELPKESAVKLLLLRNREDLDALLPQVPDFSRQNIAILLGKDAFLWWRLAKSTTTAPNLWESDFMQLAAMSALPSCSGLFLLTVASILQQDPEALTRLLGRLQVSVSPFGHVGPGAQEGELDLWLEANEENGSTALQGITVALEEKWGGSVRRMRQGPRQHLLLYSFRGNVSMADVELKGAN